MIMNSRGLLFQGSNTTVPVSKIKDCTAVRVQDKLFNKQHYFYQHFSSVFTHAPSLDTSMSEYVPNA